MTRRTTGARTVVAKIGSSSITSAGGGVDPAAVDRLCAQVAELRGLGHSVVLVSSGAIAAGWSAMGGGPRPTDPATLQAVSAVGQSKLMRVYDEAFAARGIAVGQVLLAPLDFIHRQQYLHARQTLSRLLELGVVPVVNENDATSDDEIRFGDNDRLAALVAHLVAADLLVLLTDTAGPADGGSPHHGRGVAHRRGGRGRPRARGGGGGGGQRGGQRGHGVEARRGEDRGVVGRRDRHRRRRPRRRAAGRRRGEPGVGTVFRPRGRRLPARKLWIAFAVAAAGTLVVDEGARRALVEREASLLPAGVVSVSGRFDADDAVEIAGPDGVVFAKGLARHPAALGGVVGRAPHERAARRRRSRGRAP